MKTIEEKEKLLDDLILIWHVVEKLPCDCCLQNCKESEPKCVEAYQNIRKNALDNIYRGD